MPINKVVLGTEVLIDLTEDTVTTETLAEGVTAHRADGQQIVGTMKSGGTDNEIDRILTSGLADGWKEFSDDGTIITSVDSKGRKLVKEFSDDFLTCTITLYDAEDDILGQVIKDLNPEHYTIQATDSKGQTLTKTFAPDLSTIHAVLTDSDGETLATQEKTFLNDGKRIEITVQYG